MSLALFHLRNVFRRRWRSYLAIVVLLGVVGGIGLSAIAGARRTQSAYPRFLRSVNASTLAIDPGGLNLDNANAVLAQIALRPEVVQTRTYVSFDTGELVDGRPDLEHSFEALASIDGRYFDQDRFTPTSGRLPDPTKANEVAVNETAAKALGYHVGQNLHLGTYTDDQVNDPAFADTAPPPVAEDDVTIVGIGLFPEEVVQDDYDRSSLVLFTPAFTRAHIEWGTYTWQGLVLRHGDADIDAIKNAYVSLLDPGSPQFFRTTSIDEYHALQSLRPISIALAAFGLLAFVAALLLGGQAIARQLRFESDVRQTWRALGASPRAALGTAVLPMAIVVVAGAVVAMVVAVLASPAMPIGAVRRVEVNRGFDIDWTVVAAGASALVIALTGVALFVAWRERPERAAIESSRLPRASRVVGAAASAGMSPPAVAGLRFAFEPGRGTTSVPVLSIMGSVAVAIAALVAALTFGTSLHSLVSTPERYGWNWDETVWVGGGYSNIRKGPTAAVLGADEHVAGYSDAWFGSALVDGHSLPLLGMDPGATVTPPVIEGRAVRSPDEIVLGTATIAALHKHIGDEVVLSDAHSGSELTIVGTSVFPTIGVVHGEHTSLGVGGLVSPDKIPGGTRNLSGVDDPGGNTLFVRFKPGTDVAAETAKLHGDEQTITGYQDAVVTPFHRPAEIVNASDAGSAPALLAGALVVAAVISLALALVSSVRHRRRDLALLKSLGFTRRQVSAAVTWQAMATSVVALVVGVPIGIALGRWAWTEFARQLDVVPHPDIPVAWIAVIVVGTIVMAAVAAFVPARVGRGVQPALLLRGE